MKKGVCLVCGRDIEAKPRGRIKLYCSKECRMKAHPSKRIRTKKKCPVCGNEFTPKNSRNRYCGADCRMKEHRVRMRELYRAKTKERHALNTKQCGYCGEPFHTDNWHEKYCCDECRDRANHIQAKARAKASRERNSVDKKIKLGLLRICPNCGKRYPPFTYWNGHYTGMYCCIGCCAAWMKKQKEKPLYVTPEFIQLVGQRDKGEITLKEMSEKPEIPIGTVVSRMRLYKEWQTNEI